MREITLPSGAILKLHPAPFADAKALYQAMLEEAKGLKLDPTHDIDANFYKDIFCAGFSSRRIEAAWMKCAEKAKYNDSKISDEVFEPIEARDDYLAVIFEIVSENIRPFTKNLYAQLRLIVAAIQSAQA